MMLDPLMLAISVQIEVSEAKPTGHGERIVSSVDMQEEEVGITFLSLKWKCYHQ